MLPDHFSKQSCGPSFLAPLSGLFLYPAFWLSPFLFSVSLFRFLTKARTGRHMIRPPLIGIRFTGLDQHHAGWSQSIAHICKENGSLRTRVCRAIWPTISFPSQNRRPAITHRALGPDKLRAHTCMTAFMCKPNTDQITSELTPFVVC